MTPRIPSITFAAVAAAACSQDNAALERKLDQLKVQVSAIDQKLNALGGNRAQRPRRPEPDPKAVYAVPVEGNPSAGAHDALVTIVEGYEYACPACKSARDTVAQLRSKYGDKVRVVYKQFLIHPDVATNASLAACAANRQQKFEAMDQLLWDKGYAGGRDFSPPKIEAFATEAGVDLAKFKADFDGCRESIARDQADLQAMGQGATPTFFINGRYVLGASPVALGAVIDEELALAEKRVADGTARHDYYRTWVIEKGLKKFVPPQS